MLEIVKKVMDDIFFSLKREFFHLIDLFETSDFLFCGFLMIFSLKSGFETFEGGDEFIFHIDEGSDKFVNAVFLVGFFEEFVELRELHGECGSLK